MNGIELLQTLVNLYNEAVMNGVKSDSWTTKLDSLNLADSELVIEEDKAYKGLCDVCFETTIKLVRFNALAELRDAVKDWAQNSGLIDTDIR